MFKEKYIAFLKEQLETLTPEGYNVKIIEEYGFGGKLPKHQINCYLKFGVGSKQTNVDRINQPVIFTIISESGDFRIANGIFNDLFYLLSRTHSTLEINNKTFDLWHNYNTPVVQSGIEQVGLNQRKTIIMTGVVSYSLEKIIGVKYRVGTEIMPNGMPNFVEVYPINPQTQYNTEAITPQYLNADFGYAEIEGANNTLSFQMLLDKTELSKKLLETSIKGTPLRLALEIKYGEEIGYTFNFPVKVTNVVNSHDNATGDNILSVTCMPIETF